MADQHIGYPGSVNSAQLALWLPNVGSAQYSVEGLEDGRVVISGVGDRGVTVKKGTIIGDGIVDVFENDVPLNFASVAAGAPDRWDMVVLRRTWNATPGASTSEYVIIQGGPNKSLPVRNNTKGSVADQPIALCRLRAGSSAVQEIVDLRCWAHNTGLTAVDPLVMSYLSVDLGTRLDIGGEQWVNYVRRTSAGTLSNGWEQGPMMDHVQLGGVSHGIFGGIPPSNQQFMIQAGSQTMSLDGSSYGRVVWPWQFANGLLTAIINNGDSWASGGAQFTIEGNNNFWGSSGNGNTRDVVFHAYDRSGNSIPGRFVRVNFIAIGW